jgi:hypothetical protein
MRATSSFGRRAPVLSPVEPLFAEYVQRGNVKWLRNCCFCRPWRRRANRPAQIQPVHRWVTLVGLGLILMVARARVVLVSNHSGVALATLPGGGSRWLNRLIDEQDVTHFALRPLLAAGLVTPAEIEDVWPAFHEPYRAIRAADGLTPSPFLATYLGWQRPQAFDALFIYPEGEQPARAAVIFLHGFAGNFTLQYWLVGEAGRAAGVLTVFPSTRWVGDWWSEAGEATTQATIGYLRRQGVETIYLAGLSNGRVGVSRLAPHLSAELAGLILISGLGRGLIRPGCRYSLFTAGRTSGCPSAWPALTRPWPASGRPISRWPVTTFCWLNRGLRCKR